METRVRFVPMVGISLAVMVLVVALGSWSPSLAQKEASPFSDSGKKLEPTLPSLVPINEGAPGAAAAPAPGSEPSTVLSIPRTDEPFDLNLKAVSKTAEPLPAAHGGDDPEKAAQDFVERTRQEADTAIKSLTAEAETLRARLKKVEAGLQRWQALHAAIDQNSGKPAGDRKAWRQKEGKQRVENPADRLPLPQVDSSEVSNPLPPAKESLPR